MNVRILRNLAKRYVQLCVRDPLTYKKVAVACHNINASIQRIGHTYTDVDVPMINVSDYTFKNTQKCHELYIRNSIYGTASCLELYSGYKGPICASIEHGLYFGRYVSDDDLSGFNSVITFSRTRERIIKYKYPHIETLPIGPYIQYAEPYLGNEQFDEIKKTLGKVLLVFPTHSLDGVASKYSIDQFAKRILRIRETLGADTVLVNLYYADCNRGLANEYAKYGFVTSCAGHCFDLNFLCKLKSIISLADYSISNSVGTHVGYCISMGVPHTVIDQAINYEFLTENDAAAVNAEAFESDDVKEIKDNFSIIGDITNEQIHLVEKYWGLGIKYSKNELRERLCSIEEK